MVRRGLAWLHLTLALVIAIGVFLQVYLIGAYIFGAGQGALDAHRTAGFTVHSFEVLIFLAALGAWLPRTDLGLSLVLAVLGTAQIAFAGAESWAGGLHALVALFVLVLAALLARRGLHRLWPARGWRRTDESGGLPPSMRVSTFVLIPGAGGAAWYWHRVVPLLNAAGHSAIAVDLPGPNPSAGLREYERVVTAAAAGAKSIVLVAQSMGAFTALGCCERLAVERLVLLNAMVPAPGETPSDWWGNTGHVFPSPFDEDTYFLNDVPPAVLVGAPHQRPEAEIAFTQPCAFERWPDVPTTVLAARDDRFFPFAFQQRVARERLDTDVVPVPGGHLAALSQPEAIIAAILPWAASAPRHSCVSWFTH